jgi:hypothetical protein
MTTTTKANPFTDLAQQVTSSTTTSWEPVDLLPILEGKIERPAPAFLSRTDGACLLYPGRLHWLAGEPESGKSFLALAAAAECLEGGLPVVWIDFEDCEQVLVDRLRLLGIPNQNLFHAVRYLRPSESLTASALDFLRTTVLPGAMLVVIDSATPAMIVDGLDPDSNRDVARWIGALPRAAQTAGAAVLVLDHVTKARDARGRYPRGAGHKLEAVSGASYSLDAHARAAPGRIGRARLTLQKDRHGAVRAASMGDAAGEVVIDATDPTLIVVSIEPPALLLEDGRRPSERWVLEVLPLGPEEAITVRQIGDRTAKHGHELKRTTINEACIALATEGLADGREIDNRGTKVWCHR